MDIPFRMGGYAGVFPRKFISFHCLEDEYDELKDSNSEGAENHPDFPQRSESEVVVIEETETSPSKSLAVLQVKEQWLEKLKIQTKKLLIVGGQECLLSTSDGGKEGLEKSLRDKLESFSGEGLDIIVEVDPTVVLKLLEENLVDRGSTGRNVVGVDKKMPKSSVDDILRSEFQEKRIGSVSKRPLCDMHVGAAGKRPLKSVAFQFENAGGRLSSSGCELLGVSDAGQSFPSSSPPDDTDYGTSEVESIARKRVGDVSERRVHEVAGMGLPFSSGTTMQHGLDTGRSKYYTNSFKRMLKVLEPF